MSIPLVQNNEKDSINTSIIAIKRNIERINMLLGLSNSEEIDTSKFATKDELQQAVTDLQPVDEVTSGNMQSVTSNAVAERFDVLLQNKKIKSGVTTTISGSGTYVSVNTGLSHVDNFVFSIYSSRGYNVSAYALYNPSNTGTMSIYIVSAVASANSRISWIAVGD